MLRVKKIGSSIASIYIEFLNFLFFNFLNFYKFLNISKALVFTLITWLLLALNIFKAKSDNLFIFNIKINYAVILLKLWIKRQSKLAKSINT